MASAHRCNSNRPFWSFNYAGAVNLARGGLSHYYLKRKDSLVDRLVRTETWSAWDGTLDATSSSTANIGVVVKTYIANAPIQAVKLRIWNASRCRREVSKSTGMRLRI